MHIEAMLLVNRATTYHEKKHFLAFLICIVIHIWTLMTCAVQHVTMCLLSLAILGTSSDIQLPHALKAWLSYDHTFRTVANVSLVRVADKK